MRGNKAILGGVKVNSALLPTNIVSNLRKELPNHLAKIRALRYWSQHGKEVLMHSETDLQTLNHAARNIPFHLKRWTSKWSSGTCGVGKWPQRGQEQNHDKCPRCSATNETVYHVLKFQHQGAQVCWKSGLDELQK